MTPWVLRLIVANVLMYLVTHGNVLPPQVTNSLVLVPALIPVRPWTPFTYMFLHAAGLWHIGLNMIVLYFFGPRLEARIGGGHFLGLYFASGLGGAALSFVMTPTVPIIGASAAIFGVVLAFALYWPHERVYIWGILPIEARWLAVGMAALELSGGFLGFEPGVAHFAHLGGFAAGYLYLRWMHYRSPARRFKQRAAAVTEINRHQSEADALRRWSSIRREGLHEINRTEVDRLLEKVATSGPGSLTPDERACLDRFSMR
jgi:membrane associated rhomboid family serine protease